MPKREQRGERRQRKSKRREERAQRKAIDKSLTAHPEDEVEVKTLWERLREWIDSLSPEAKKILREASGALLTFSALFTAWAFSGKEAGALGKILNNLFSWVLGNSKYIFSAYLLLLGLYLISPTLPTGKFLVGSTILLISSILIVTPSDQVKTLASHMRRELEGLLGATPTAWLLWIGLGLGVIILIERELRDVITNLWDVISNGLRALLKFMRRRQAALAIANNSPDSSVSQPEREQFEKDETLESEVTALESEVELNLAESESQEDEDEESSSEVEIDLRKLEPVKPKDLTPKQKVKRKTSIDIEEILSYIDFSEDEYILPPKNFLKGIASRIYGNTSKVKVKEGDYSKLLEQTLRDFGVEAKVIKVQRGPTVTRYELQPARGVKVSQITRLKDDLALSLAAIAIRIEAPIPGKSAIGIEVPNRQVEPVYLAEILASDEFQETEANLPLAIGKDISGNVIIGDLSKMPHLLIAGATGSGKTVCINSILVSLLYKLTPEQVQLILIDPKMVELVLYEDIPHLVELSTDVQKAPKVLRGAVKIMEDRYKLFSQNKVRNISEYNSVADQPLPYIVIVIDELADLMMTSASSVETSIARLAQLARAAGIHLIVATQRPSVNVITGIIKANIPSRIAFAVASQVDSRVIIDQAGAENLIGRGDMLYWPIGAPRPIRVQGAFVGLKEIEAITEFWRRQRKPRNLTELTLVEEPSGLPGEVGDEEGDKALIKEAIKVILMEKKASTTLLQRRLKIGFARAGRLMDTLEKMGVVGPQEGSKPRKILVDESYLEQLENHSSN